MEFVPSIGSSQDFWESQRVSSAPSDTSPTTTHNTVIPVNCPIVEEIDPVNCVLTNLLQDEIDCETRTPRLTSNNAQPSDIATTTSQRCANTNRRCIESRAQRRVVAF
jgi:hypothetical protein